MKREKINTMILLALFIAIEVIFCFTPLGSLSLGPGILATLSHIPPLVAVFILGRRNGVFMGLVFGICSLIVWSTSLLASPSAFAFTPLAPNGNVWSLVICLLPRILFPLFAGLIYDLLANKCNKAVSAGVAGAVGTLLHSLMVLSLLYVCFRGHETVGDSYLNVLLLWGGVNAVMEILVGAVASAGIVPVLAKIKRG